jgi:uncharacterized protein with ParB-like and HNH nuclease domain
MAIQADHKDIITLIMGDLTQFHIPIYQRTYTWEANEQVDKLLDDIKSFGEEYKDNKRAEYYIGNVILKNQTRAFVNERVVIDGQQRITTSILILCAIRDLYRNKFFSEKGSRTANDIHKYIYSPDGIDIKLKLNNMENQQALTNLLSGSSSAISLADKRTKYYRNYEHIYKRLSRMDEAEFDVFLDLLRRVKVVIIFLDEDQDENSVFESINSSGKPLAGSDLIKNYLFTFKNYDCSHPNETELINLYTRTFESIFKNSENEENKEDEEEVREQFFRVYIALKTQWLYKNDPKILYYKFKEVVGEITSINSLKDIIDDLAKWALIYQTLRVKNHLDINSNYIGYLRTSFAIYSSLMMKLLEHYSHIESNELIIDNPLEFNKAIKALVAYDAARFLANYPAGELTRFIPMVFERLESNDFNLSSGYGDRFLTLVTRAQAGHQLPSIKVLKEKVVTNDLYSRKSKYIKKFLVLLENIGKNELLDYEKDLKKAEIEHIVPQNPAIDQWNSISFEEHEKYLHTLGNLTLTFDNKSLSNKGFDEKRTILREKSRIKLNDELARYDDFNAQAIESRAISMLDKFLHEFLNVANINAIS